VTVTGEVSGQNFTAIPSVYTSPSVYTVFLPLTVR
jgi:hypothetical protein